MAAREKKEKEEQLKKIREKQEQERARIQNIKSQKQALELKEYNLRTALLQESLKSIETMRREYAKKQNILEKKLEWENYVNCERRPKPNILSQLSNYLDKWEEEIDFDENKKLTWLLEVDERSVISQDIDMKRSDLKTIRNLQPVIGDKYWIKSKEVLIILNDIKNTISLSRNKNFVFELKKIQEKFRIRLQTFLDLFTFEILSNIERDMIEINPYLAEYFYSSDIFNVGHFATRPVPQIHDIWLDNFTTTIDLKSPKSKIILPKSIRFDGHAFRGLWMRYDHFSDQAPSFNLKNEPINIVDLKEANKIEWTIRTKMKEDEVKRLINLRTAWEEREEKRAENELEQARAKKNDKKPKKKKEKKVKDPEPPKIDANYVVEIDAWYLTFENEMEKIILAGLGPDTLQLEDYELNLREFNMLGGIYGFNYLNTPNQTRKVDDKVMLRLDANDILHYNIFREEYIPVSFDDSYSYADEYELNKAKMIDAKEQAKLIGFTIKLAENVFWWTTPVVCWWEPWEQSKEFLGLSPKLQDFHINYDKYMEQLQKRLFTVPLTETDYTKVETINDFPLEKIPESLDIISFTKRHVNPRISDNYKFDCELDEEQEILRKQGLREKEKEMDIAEEKERKFRLFMEQIDKERANANEQRLEMTIQLQNAQRIKRQAEMKRLVNAGTTEKQLQKFLDHKDEEDTQNLKEIIENDVQIFEDYVAAQVKQYFEIEKSLEVPKIVKSNVETEQPKSFFPIVQRQIPLRIISQTNPDYYITFDMPEEANKKLKPIQVSRPDADSALISDFLKYAKMLRFYDNPNMDKRKYIGQLQIQDDKDEEMVELKNAIEEPLQKEKVVAKKNKLLEKTATPLIITPKTNRSKSRKTEVLELISHYPGKWTTDGIYYTEFDPKTNKISFKSGRLGIFGIALPKYCNFPIKKWSLSPNPDKKGSVDFIIEGQYCDIKIEITEEGFYYRILRPADKKVPLAKHKIPPNKTAITLNHLIEFLISSGINFFPDRDAGFYIENICEKHLPMETHAYFCLAQFTTSFHFQSMVYNRFAHRRIALLYARQIIENAESIEEFKEIVIMPLRCYFGVTSELCTSLDIVQLKHNMWPENQEFYPDILHLLYDVSNELSRRKRDQMKPLLRYNIAGILRAVRPFSFS